MERLSYICNLETGEERLISGRHDFVPTADGAFLTEPEPLAFYEMSAILGGGKNGSAMNPVYTDSSINDDYQSFGILSSSGATVLRVLTGRNGPLLVKDFEVSMTPSGRHEIRPRTAEPLRPCAEKHLSLPMLSKDGGRFAAYDVSRGWPDATMKVYELGEHADGCREVLDLGFKTGKVDFSYDGDELAFAMAAPGRERANSAYAFLNQAFVYKISTGELLQLTTGRKRSFQSFPAFLPDGRVVVLNTPHLAKIGDPWNPANPNLLNRGDNFEIYALDRKNGRICPEQGANTARGDETPPVKIVGYNQTVDTEECRRHARDVWKATQIHAPGTPLKELAEKEMGMICPDRAAARATDAGSFADSDLRAVLGSSSAAVVYFWSPKMPLSVKSIEDIQAAAAELKIQLIVLLDPDADQDLAQKIIKRNRLDAIYLRKLNSPDIMRKGVLLHYPSVLVINRGKISGDYIPGSKSRQEYVRLIRIRLNRR